jgi:dihydroorotase
VPILIEMIDGARKRGVDVTTEAYPYTAGSTRLESAIFDSGWPERIGIGYHDLQWSATGERLTAETFEKYRKQGGWVVIHMIPEDMVRYAIANPTVMVASDGVPLVNGLGHPRGPGTFARVLGHYVREEKALSLMDAVRKMTLMPAKRLESVAPQMREKGRIRVGADADITVFDPALVIDKATYEKASQYSEGIPFVLVGGTFVVRDSKLVDSATPGRAIRAVRPTSSR